MRKRHLASLLLTLLIPLVAQAAGTADYLLTNGYIYTVNPEQPWADSLAINGSRISYVGNKEDAEKLVDHRTQVVDLQGKMLLPGFQDAHIHPISAELRQNQLSLYSLKGRQSYIKALDDYARANPDISWIQGAGWSHEYFSDDNPPTREQLDAVVNDRPVTLKSYDGHSLWVNSRALEIAGVDADTPDVAGGEIVRKPDSREPSGLMIEDFAQRLVLDHRPDYSDSERYIALIKTQAYLHSLGITSIQDALIDLDHVGDYGSLPTYLKAARAGDLTLRVVGALYWNPQKGMEQLDDMIEARDSYSAGNFRATSVKVWQDGVMHTRSAKLLKDYSDDPGNRGTDMNPIPRLQELVVAADRENFQVHCHADGDGAVRDCLDAIELARKKNGKRDNRHHIAHLELIHPEDIPRFKQLGVTANVQPMWSTHAPYIEDLVKNKLGADRKRWLEINRSFFDHGVRVAYGSDWFVTSANPLDLIEAAVTRIRPLLPLETKRTATPPLPGEEVSLEQAIGAITLGSAYVNHQDKSTGSLEVGKLADLVVLEHNLFEIPAVEISDTRVVMTFVGGKLVHGNPAAK